MTNETHLFIKICISLTLFSKGLMFLWCVRDEWRQGQIAILTHLLLLTIARCVISKDPLRTSSAFWLGLLTRGSLRPFLSPTLLTQAFLPPTNSTATGICQYSFLTSTCFRFFFSSFTHVHLLIDGSVKGQYITYSLRNHIHCTVCKHITIKWDCQYLIAKVETI